MRFLRAIVVVGSMLLAGGRPSSLAAQQQPFDFGVPVTSPDRVIGP